jgi:hypothetical protein
MRAHSQRTGQRQRGGARAHATSIGETMAQRFLSVSCFCRFIDKIVLTSYNRQTNFLSIVYIFAGSLH